MLEKLLLAAAATFSVYIFSGVELPNQIWSAIAHPTSESSTQVEKEAELIPSLEDNQNKVDPWKTLADNYISQ